jgi:hypothetical protein
VPATRQTALALQPVLHSATGSVLSQTPHPCSTHCPLALQFNAVAPWFTMLVPHPDVGRPASIEFAPQQVAAPGVHSPVHCPLPVQTYVHGVPGAHIPLLPHDCGVVPMHVCWPGPHCPVHPTPATHVTLVPHALPLFCHCPVAPHDSGCWPLQPIWVGPH